MRRKDREITDFNEIEAILEKCDACRLGLIDNGMPYVVPMNFGFRADNQEITLYFHCAKEGRKIDILNRNPLVCVEMDCGHLLIIGDKACEYSMDYESLIGTGNVEFIEDNIGKTDALTHIMKKYTGESNFSFDEKLFDRTVLFKVIINEFTGKRHFTN